MDTYYHGTYQSCPKNPSYLASPEFLLLSCHIGSVFNFIFSFYTVFLILKKSPPAMKSAVPFMINLAIWTWICDLAWSVLMLPMLFVPIIGASCNGILCPFLSAKLLTWIAFAAIGVMGISIVSMFEQRQRSIVMRSRFVMRKRTTRFILFSILYTYHLNFGLPEVITWPQDQENAKLSHLNLVPCPPEIYFTSKSYILQLDAKLLSPHMCVSIILGTSTCLFYAFHTLYHLLPKNNPSMSASTRKMLMNFFIAMLIQCSIPTFVIIVPTLYWNMSASFGFYSQELNNVSIFFFTMHGVSGSIATCCLYGPYRKYTKTLIMNKLLRFPEQSNSTVVSLAGRTRQRETKI